MTSDFEDLLRAFDQFSVKYLIVGGHAVMLYTEPRYTKDFDVWVEPRAENAAKVFEALGSFGAPLTGMKPADFATEGLVYQIGVPPLRIDILMSIAGLTFQDAWANRHEANFGTVPAHFLGRQDLIRNKRSVGRHIDLHDAEMLEL